MIKILDKDIAKLESKIDRFNHTLDEKILSAHSRKCHLVSIIAHIITACGRIILH